MKRVAIIGSGNWGTTIAKIIANNIIETTHFDPEVLMWVCEESYQHQKLSEYINAMRSNPIYLPGVRLPENIRAVVDFDEINLADILVVCLPTRFIGTIRQVKPKKDAFAVNLSKGFILNDKKLQVPSEYIKGVWNIDCCSLMGGNIAVEIAMDLLAECTIGYLTKDQMVCLEWMFDCETFRPRMIPYDIGIEVCGGLKNILSLGIGIVDGMDWGSNTKAILFRKGLVEIERFCKAIKAKFFILESCCIGDVFTSCLSGRNFRCGIEMAKNRSKSADIERRMGGQKLEGPETAKIIAEWCEINEREIKEFPIIQAIHRICFLGESPEYLYDVLKRNNE